jgi:hypothetical protein
VLPARKEAYALMHGKAGQFILGETIEMKAILDRGELKRLVWVELKDAPGTYIRAIEALTPYARIVALLRARAGIIT